jgi:hypothetical protein
VTFLQLTLLRQHINEGAMEPSRALPLCIVGEGGAFRT